MTRTFTVSYGSEDYQVRANTAMEAVRQATRMIPNLVIHPGVEEQPQYGCYIWKFTVTTPGEGFVVWVRERYSFDYSGEGV
jgi:hypothetical protein